MNELEVFLSDDFVGFSAKIGEIHTQLKEKSEHVKKVLEQYKVEKTDLEQKAKTLLAEWDAKKKEIVRK